MCVCSFAKLVNIIITALPAHIRLPTKIGWGGGYHPDISAGFEVTGDTALSLSQFDGVQ